MQSAITDLAGLRYWAHPGVDLHYVTHPESIEEVERLVGPGTVEWARPPISPEFLAPRTRRDAREALGVDAHARMVLVSGGGWGVGDLESAIELALADGETEVVCIAGRNEIAQRKLEARFGDNPRVRVLGFTDQMSDWMAAADAMVHATAGLTVLEAHIRGCPVISYGFTAGHLRANNAAFERFGIAEVARSDHELESTLRHVTAERRSPDSSFASLPSIASRALTVRPRVRQEPIWRLRAARAVAVTCLAIIAVVLVISAVHRESPLRPLHPVTSRIHFGTDSDATQAAQKPRPDRILARRRRRNRGGRRRIRALSAERRLAGAGALALAVAVPHAGPALAPIVPAVGRRLPVVLREEEAEGIFLTFDDGPHPQGTPAVLEILREAGQTATFFLAGEQVERRPALAAEIVAAGHRVELHCHRHRNQLRLTPRALLDDAERGRAAIEEASGQAIADYRPPYGIFSGAGLAAIRSRGWRPVLWSQWGRDWTRRATAASITQQGDRRNSPWGHRPFARRGLLQRAELLGAHRVSSAENSRGAHDARAEVERASPLTRRRDGPLVAAREGFVEQLGHRAARPVLVEDLLGHCSPSSIGGFHKGSPPGRTKNLHFADFANSCSLGALRRRRKVGAIRGHYFRLIERYEGRRVGYQHQFRAADIGGEAFGAGQRKEACRRAPRGAAGESGCRAGPPRRRA